MNITTSVIIYSLKALVAGSIFFVWVVRYQNIIDEFKFYGLPEWLRDLVGILKLSFAAMLFSPEITVVIIASTGIGLLMLAALITHLRIKNSFYKMLPSISLILISGIITVFILRGL